MDITKLDENVLGAVRQRLGAEDEDDESKDARIQGMDAGTVFRLFLEWEGIHGYAETIIQALDNIREAAEED